MPKFYLSLLIAVITLSGKTYAQHALTVTEKYTVMLEAQVQDSPPQITLSWKAHGDAVGFTIFRKTKSSPGWGSSIGSVGASATSYVDNAVSPDSAYEYYILKGGAAQGTGYIYAGIKAPAIHSRGALLLIVDSTFTDSCSVEIAQLIKDISGDGWEVLRKDFNRTTTDVTIKNYIKSQKQSTPSLNAVFILGHVAVPYSGNLNPDAHNNHAGAWPADVFYGEMDGTWTDNSVNTDNNSGGIIPPPRPENVNKPGDGKWDQSAIPSDVELQVSRVDFAKMPAFSASEVQMMKNYLNKNHQYKMNAISTNHRLLVDDNFGLGTNEPFAANALRLSALVGRNNMSSLDFISTLDANNYQWAYGCGGGSYTSCSGVGSTTNFVGKNTNAIFTMLFGSYFGDWDAQNDLLRAPLCTNTPALASCWAGRPHWFFHHMALGENIGYSARLAQNNSGANPLYQVYYNNSHRGVHIALMGDLTLRTEYVKPATGVAMTSDPAAGAIITWTASAEPGIAGYYIYRSESEFGNYQLRSPLVTGTSFTDSFGSAGMKYYMVRAVKLQQTPSGSYYNLGIGTTTSGNASYPKFDIGVNRVTHISAEISIFPNPAKDKLHILATAAKQAEAEFSITDINGRKLLSEFRNLHEGANTVSFDIQQLPAGVYVATVQTADGSINKKWIKID